MAAAAHTQREGRPYRYRVQAWTNRSHNSYYFDEYEDARMRYMHLLMSQVMEERYVKKVRFERSSYGSYQTIFEGRVFHPSPNDRPEGWEYDGD